MFFLVFLDFIFLVEDLFFDNLSTSSDLILLYNSYKLSYILSQSLLINSLNWSLDIGITRVEYILVEEEEGIDGRDEVLEKEERGTEGIEVEEGTEGTEGGSRVSDFIWLSTLVIFLYYPCCFLVWAIISAVRLYSSSVFWPLLQ